MAEEKTETRVDEWMRDAAKEHIPAPHNYLDDFNTRKYIGKRRRELESVIAKHYDKWLASHAPSAPKGNLVKLASKVVSTRDAWWKKRDRPPDSQERDDFLGAIADLTEAVLHAPAAPAASATGTETRVDEWVSGAVAEIQRRNRMRGHVLRTRKGKVADVMESWEMAQIIAKHYEKWQSSTLLAERNRTINECASLVESLVTKTSSLFVVAEAIRNLKIKPSSATPAASVPEGRTEKE